MDDRVLFCNVHWVQLPPTLQQPISSNQEAPNATNIAAVRTVLKGTAAAVSYIAKREGRARAQKTAAQTQSFAAGQSGSPTLTSGGSSGSIGTGGGVTYGAGEGLTSRSGNIQ